MFDDRNSKLSNMLKKLEKRVGKTFNTTRNKRICLDSLIHPVEVLFDDAHIPYIYAENTQDLVLTQGYLHASDRLFQLEMMRRLAKGELSSIAGKTPIKTRDWSRHFQGLTMVEFDLFWRSFDLVEAAKRSYQQATPEYRLLAAAMAEGVNAYLARNRFRRSIEVQLTGLKIAPWTPIDPFIVYKGFAASLALIWQAKLTLASLIEAYPDAADELRRLFALTANVEQTKISQPALAQTTRKLAALGRSALEVTGYNASGYGSNAWAVSGERSKSGKPLLACDPHLPLMAPCIGYLQHLEAPGFKAAGYAGPGIPGLTMGHNEHYGFAITHAWIDDCDLFLEKIEDGNLRRGEKTFPIAEKRIEIDIRGKGKRAHRIRQSEHGVFLSDVLNGGYQPERSLGEKEAISLCWTGREGGRDLEAYWGLCTASSWDEFRAASSLFAAPAWNLIYADKQGHIGYQLAGWVPKRTWQGGLDLLNGESCCKWDGMVDFEALPHAFDPPEGIIASANQRIVGREYPIYLSELFEPPYRADRAKAFLGTGKHSVATMRDLQNDSRSFWAEKIVDNYLGRIDDYQRPNARFAMMILRGWNGDMAHYRIEPSVFYLFLYHYVEKTFKTKLGQELGALLLERFTMPALAIEKIISRAESYWFGDTDAHAIIEDALDDAIADLTQRFGSDSDQWQWGRIHQRTHYHALGDLPGIGRLFNIGPRPASGDGTTTSSGILRFSEPFDQFGGADARLIIDLADWEACRWILATGQSATPLSPYYHDQFELLMAGQDRPWHFERCEIEKRRDHRWRFEKA